jgi:hypothetical protein
MKEREGLILAEQDGTSVLGDGPEFISARRSRNQAKK